LETVPSATSHDGDPDDAGLTRFVEVKSTKQYLADIWSRREFTLALPVEQLRTAHLDTFLGNIWHLGHPLLTSGVYYLVFGTILQTSKGIANYPLWLMIGVFSYQLTSSTILGGASTISTRQGLMRSFLFPRAIIPISNTISHLITFGFQLGVLFVLSIATGAGVSVRWLLLPIILLIHTALNLGGAFVAARLNDSFQDIEHLIPFLFRLLQYTSGVMFSIDRFSNSSNAAARALVTHNPIVTILNLYRWMILGTPVGTRNLVETCVVAALILIFGLRFFRVAENRYGRL
jgi:teichoic acid transport system permease protein